MGMGDIQYPLSIDELKGDRNLRYERLFQSLNLQCLRTLVKNVA
jgi:hypothetical protein